MKIDDLKADLENGSTTYKGTCHDCQKAVTVTAKVAEEGLITIEGGAVYKVRQGPEYTYFFKCDECFKSDPILHDCIECEVYSRVVGYLRPVSQWNKGKKAEWERRVEFRNTTDNPESLKGA